MKNLILSLVLLIGFTIISTILIVGCGGNTDEIRLKRETLDKEERQKLVGRTIKSVDRINGSIVIWFLDDSHVTFKDDYHDTIEFSETK